MVTHDIITYLLNKIGSTYHSVEEFLRGESSDIIKKLTKLHQIWLAGRASASMGGLWRTGALTPEEVEDLATLAADFTALGKARDDLS